MTARVDVREYGHTDTGVHLLGEATLMGTGAFIREVRGLARVRTVQGLAVAKLAVLVASAAAGGVGLVVGYKFLPRRHSTDVGSKTADDAEKSTTY